MRIWEGKKSLDKKKRSEYLIQSRINHWIELILCIESIQYRQFLLSAIEEVEEEIQPCDSNAGPENNGKQRKKKEEKKGFGNNYLENLTENTKFKL